MFPQIAVGGSNGMNSTLRRKVDVPFHQMLGTVIGGKDSFTADHKADFMAPLAVFWHGISIHAPHFADLINQNISKVFGPSGGIILKKPVKPIVLS